MGQSCGARTIISISLMRKLRPRDATYFIQICIQIGETQSWASELDRLSIQTSSLARTSPCPSWWLTARSLITRMHPESKTSDSTFLGRAQRGKQNPPTASQNSESEDGPRIACDWEATGLRGQVGAAQGGHKGASSDFSLVPSKPQTPLSLCVVPIPG